MPAASILESLAPHLEAIAALMGKGTTVEHAGAALAAGDGAAVRAAAKVTGVSEHAINAEIATAHGAATNDAIPMGASDQALVPYDNAKTPSGSTLMDDAGTRMSKYPEPPPRTPDGVMKGEVVTGGALPAAGEGQGGKVQLGAGDEHPVAYSGAEPTVQQRAESALSPEAEEYLVKRNNRQTGEHADADAAATDAATTEENWRPPLKVGNYPEASKTGVGLGLAGAAAGAGALAAGGDTREGGDAAWLSGGLAPDKPEYIEGAKSLGDSMGESFQARADKFLAGGKTFPPGGVNTASSGKGADGLAVSGPAGAPTAQQAAQAGGAPALPSQPTGDVKADKSLMARAQQALSDLQMAHDDPASRIAIDKVNEMVEQIKDDYKAEKNDLKFGQAWETVANALGKLGAGLYGMQHNVDMSGTKFDKQDWLGEMKNLREEFATRLADVEGERKAVESKREHDLRFGEAKARLGEAYDALAVNQQTAREHNATQRQIAAQHVQATMAGIAASDKQHQERIDVQVAELNRKGEHDAATQLRDLNRTQQAALSKFQGDMAAATANPKDKGKFAAAAVEFNNVLNLQHVPPKERDEISKRIFGLTARDNFDSSRLTEKLLDESVMTVGKNVVTALNDVTERYPLSAQIIHQPPLKLPHGLDVGQPQPAGPAPAPTPPAPVSNTAGSPPPLPPGQSYIKVNGKYMVVDSAKLGK